MDFENLLTDIWTYFLNSKILIIWIFIATGLLVSMIIIIHKIQGKIRDKKLIKSVTNIHRGTNSERDLVLRLLKNNIPAQTIFHDLYVNLNNGKFSQIDVVVATKVGILVFEVKDFSGWIYGNGNQSQWTKVLAYGQQKYRFYNPIMQNNKHIESLRKQLKQFENIPFYSIIVFYGDCELKDVNFIPKDTYLVYSKRVFEVIEIILQNNEPAPYTDKKDVIKILKEAVINGEILEYQVQHKNNINEMLGTDRIFN